MGCVMCADKALFGSRLAVRLLLATAAATILSGCSDATRLSQNPFTNPFETASSAPVDRTPTGTISSSPRHAASTRIESQPLAPPSGASSLPAPSVNAAPRPVASAGPSRMSPASIDHWSAEGGTPIVVAQGETVSALSARYGVPPEALLKVNGFNSASQVQPGARLVVPVYRSGRTAAAAPASVETPRPAAPAPVAKAEPRKPEPARAEARKETYRLVKGPESVRGSHDAAAEKTARADKLREEKKLKAEKLALEKKQAAEKAEKAKLAREEARKPRKQAQAEKPVEQAISKPAKQRQATLETPAAKPEPKKVDVDRETTASLPKEEPKQAAADANPEFRWPARGRIIQGFKSGGNDGINIAVPEGTAVKAAEGGVVKDAGSELKGYGNLVLIQHPNGFVSAYAHNGELDVKRGDTVKRGQTIAKAGQTGNVSSPQVHFELRKGSTPVDPTGFLAGL